MTFISNVFEEGQSQNSIPHKQHYWQ
jgi:hypothetical protein